MESVFLFAIFTLYFQCCYADTDISVVFVMAKHLEQQLHDIKDNVEDNKRRYVPL